MEAMRAVVAREVGEPGDVLAVERVSTRSLIYGGKTVRGFFLSRWFATTPQAEGGAGAASVTGAVVRLLHDLWRTG